MDHYGHQIVEQLSSGGGGGVVHSVGGHVQSPQGKQHGGVQLGAGEGSEVEALEMDAQDLDRKTQTSGTLV